jgi:hypothetical protein
VVWSSWRKPARRQIPHSRHTRRRIGKPTFLGPTVELLEDRLSRSPRAFFSTPTGNPDHINHIRFRRLRPNGFLLSWEDLTHGGDRDFNDVVMSVRLVNLGI